VIVLDASVVIAHLDAQDVHHERATALISETKDDLGVSPITLAEVLIGPVRLKRLPAAEAAIQDLQIATVGLTAHSPARLATLRVDTRLRMPDCCVLLAAETARASVATFDTRLADAARELGLTVHS
jgi:predicted nucleic acid-binding protein